VAINGASGGVGTFAVQIAKVLGAEVTACAAPETSTWSGRSARTTSSDYSQDDFTRDAQRYDVVFDLVGNHALAELRRALTPSGDARALRRWRVARRRAEPGRSDATHARRDDPVALSPVVSGCSCTMACIRVRRTWPSCANSVESGQITPVIDKVYPLSDVPEAIRYLEMEHPRAKVIIAV
jgi:NADPH:quinone reductase-like Zn-dependent oxidoreductase